MFTKYQSIKTYAFPMCLLLSILLGGLLGYFDGNMAVTLKPLGDLFLNLILTAVVPLIFFTVSSAIAKMGSVQKLEKVICYMMLVFLITSIIAAVAALCLVKFSPSLQSLPIHTKVPQKISSINFISQLVNIFTVPEFSTLLSHQHILALVVFSMLVGLATLSLREKGTLFASFLKSGEEIFMRVFSLIMYYAPIGFFAYFAVLVHDLGPKLIENYIHIAIIYYAFTISYFMIMYTIYAYLSGKMKGIILFWKHVFLPMITAIATCSSAASIPANLVATQKMHIPVEINEMVVPLGGIIHKEGSIIGGMIKIAFLFSLFHLNFSGLSVLLTAVSVSILVGTVMGAIPSGGMLGELLILSIYGFPPSTLLLIAAISMIIDPIATMLNVTGNTISSMLVARLVMGKRWMKTQSM